MRRVLLITLLIISFTGFSQEKTWQKKVDWNGYTQLRASSNFTDNTTLMVRRLKFWVKSTPDFSKHWSYKVQVLFTSWMQEKFFLQDVKINYKAGLFSIDMGQFVPTYGLQWTQPDYKIPALERAMVVNALHPDGTLGVRDLGFQINFHTKNHLIETHFGVFNGYGIIEYRFNNQGFMVSHKTAVNIPLQNNKLQLGYSLMYRYADNLQLKHIFPDSVLYSGKDFRFNVFAMFRSKYINLQAEFQNANFENNKAYGYYVLSDINIKKSQIVLSVENYKNTFSKKQSPFYRIGYNYLIKKYKIKVFLDNYFQITNGGFDNYYASVQLQIFLK